jgi:quercetin dioxygenase-like cupin family protein
MTEEVFKFTVTDEKTIEKVITDENIHYIHMVLGKGEGFPEHNANANVYMSVVRGRLSIEIEGGGVREYERGSVLKIPFGSRMKGENRDDDTMELIIVKAPAPKG